MVSTAMPKTTRRRQSSSVQSPLETYLREINETSLLSADDEHELAIAIGLGDTQARDRMVRANLRLVVNIARGYTGETTEVFAYPTDPTYPAPIERVVGVPLKSYITATVTYRFR